MASSLMYPAPSNKPRPPVSPYAGFQQPGPSRPEEPQRVRHKTHTFRKSWLGVVNLGQWEVGVQELNAYRLEGCFNTRALISTARVYKMG